MRFQTLKFSSALLPATLLMVILGGCVNSRMPSITGLSSSKNSTSDSGVVGGTGATDTDKFVIGRIDVAAAPTGGNGAGAAPLATIFFDSSRSTPAGGGSTTPLISQHCTNAGNNGAAGKSCLCQYTWSESNGSTGSNLSYTRTVIKPVTNAQQQLVTCSTPDVYTAEIPDGTSIRVTVKGAPGNPDAGLFSVNTYTYTKTGSVATGSFQDAQGRAFENIVHYSCFEQFKIGTAIQSKMGTESNPNGESARYPIANKFCVQNPNQAPSQDCPNLPAGTTNSAQAYYYNFFTRVSLVGAVNQWNDRYTCPAVKEPIYGTGTAGDAAKPYPMDTNFALAVSANGQFNIGVDGFVELANGGGDPIAAQAKMCNGSVGPGNASSDGFVTACLGYAAKPAADGTCPYITDRNNQIHMTYRLRRFTALYPPLFGIDGKAPTRGQRFDQIYVLDRPVLPGSNASPGDSRYKPFTMRGPKPCPFALFDAKGVTGLIDAAYTDSKLPIYSATNNTRWNGTNVDNIQFPNADNANSCSTAMPLIKSDVLQPDIVVASIGTVHSTNPTLKRVFVRPIQSWAPHYEEDTKFQACAPQASPIREAPLHFAKDPTTGNVSWCAEVYPTQNDHVSALDQLGNPNAPAGVNNRYIGHVRPFTSHVVKNSLSADCTASIPTIPSPIGGTQIYPAADSGAACTAISANPSGVARHPANMQMDTKNVFPIGGGTPTTRNVCANQTCDRTAIPTGGLQWTKFPLLATALQTESAISRDSTYGCVVTYDAGGVKAGKSTPSGGCCGNNVALKTGLPGINNPSTDPGIVNQNAHLEPDSPCLTPAY